MTQHKVAPLFSSPPPSFPSFHAFHALHRYRRMDAFDRDISLPSWTYDGPPEHGSVGLGNCSHYHRRGHNLFSSINSPGLNEAESHAILLLGVQCMCTQ